MEHHWGKGGRHVLMSFRICFQNEFKIRYHLKMCFKVFYEYLSVVELLQGLHLKSLTVIVCVIEHICHLVLQRKIIFSNQLNIFYFPEDKNTIFVREGVGGLMDFNFEQIYICPVKLVNN